MRLIPNKYNGYSADGIRLCFKGGGGGGGGQREATDEERRLWGAQATSLEQMNQIALPNLTTGMNNLGTLTNEAMDGTLTNRLRDQALTDVNTSLGTSANDVLRTMSSRGATFDPTSASGADVMSQWGLGAAKQRAVAAGLATMAGEDTKWNRNAALTGLASGQGAQSIQGMGQLAAQMGNSRRSEDDMEQRDNAKTIAGLAVGGKMFGLYKDGGAVKCSDGISPSGLRMFSPTKMPSPTQFSASSGEEPKTDGGAASTLVNAATSSMGTRMMANGLDKVGISAPKAAIDGLTTAGKEVISSLGTDATFAPIAAEKAAEATAAGFSGEGAAFATETLAADAALATEATTAGALGGLGTAAAAAAPWLIGGYAIGSMLDLWADGGDVSEGRTDMTGGGDVQGPGTETSDSIPARLSDGEIVENADAVNLDPKETKDVITEWAQKDGTTKDLLLAINNKGLESRYGKEAAKKNPRYENGVQNFAFGGLAALGQGLYQAAPILNQIDRQRKDDEFRTEQLGFQRSQDARAQTAHDAQMELTGTQISEVKRKMAEESAIREAGIKHFKPIADAAKAHGAWKQGVNDDEIAGQLSSIYDQVPDGKSLVPTDESDASGKIFRLKDNKTGEFIGPGMSSRQVVENTIGNKNYMLKMMRDAQDRFTVEGASINPELAGKYLDRITAEQERVRKEMVENQKLLNEGRRIDNQEQHNNILAMGVLGKGIPGYGGGGSRSGASSGVAAHSSNNEQRGVLSQFKPNELNSTIDSVIGKEGAEPNFGEKIKVNGQDFRRGFQSSLYELDAANKFGNPGELINTAYRIERAKYDPSGEAGVNITPEKGADGQLRMVAVVDGRKYQLSEKPATTEMIDAWYKPRLESVKDNPQAVVAIKNQRNLMVAESQQSTIESQLKAATTKPVFDAYIRSRVAQGMSKEDAAAQFQDELASLRSALKEANGRVQSLSQVEKTEMPGYYKGDTGQLGDKPESSALQTPGGAARWEATKGSLPNMFTPGGIRAQKATSDALKSAGTVISPVFGLR